MAISVNTVATLADLQAINDDLSANYLITADIDATATAGWNSGAGFLPLGNGSARFTGRLYGGGHTIFGLVINRPTTDYVGLCGYVDGGVVSGVRLFACDISGQDWTAGITGRLRESTVASCFVSGAISGRTNTGGIVGETVLEPGQILGCKTNVKITATGEYAGGIVGRIRTRGLCHRCSSSGDVAGTSYVGGVCGESGSSDLSSECFSACSVSGNSWVGGFIGHANLSSLEHRNCYATGSVVATTNHGGGFVGRNREGAINKCFSTGQVTGPNVGGFSNDSFNGTYADCFWDIQSSGTGTSDGGTGKTTAEMQTIETYIDTETEGLDDAWDMVSEKSLSSIWGITSGYPFLQYLGEPPGLLVPIQSGFTGIESITRSIGT